jgi:hypothetical protein
VFIGLSDEMTDGRGEEERERERARREREKGRVRESEREDKQTQSEERRGKLWLLLTHRLSVCQRLHQRPRQREV